MQTSLAEIPAPPSFWTRADARATLLGLLLLLAATALLATVPAALASLGLGLAAAATARLPARWWLDRLPGVGLFLGLLLVVVPLSVPGAGWGPFSARGLELAALLAAKILAALVWSALLLAAAPFGALANAAWRLGLPGRAAHLLVLTHRHVLALNDRLGQLRIALRLRGFRNRPDRRSWRTIGLAAGTLLVRSHDQAERVGQALACRGYAGRPRLLAAGRFRLRDAALLLLLAALAAGLGLVDILRPFS